MPIRAANIKVAIKRRILIFDTSLEGVSPRNWTWIFSFEGEERTSDIRLS